MKKQIDKEATIQKILDWGNRSIGHQINMTKFNKAMNQPDWEKALKKFAKFCETEIIYLKQIDKEASIQKILEAGAKDKVHNINKEEFLESMELETWDESIKRFAAFYKIEPVYLPE